MRKSSSGRRTRDDSGWGKPFEDRRDGPKYNEQLVLRGEFFLNFGPLRHRKGELARMNDGKRGGQYRFPTSFVRWLVICTQFLDYRSLEGLTRRFASLGLIPAAADSTTLWHRLHGMTPEVKLPKYSELELATDGTGLTTSNGGESRIFRYGDPDAKQRKHLVVVITADVRRKKLLAIEVHIEGKGHSESETGAAHVRAATARGYRVRKFYGEGASDTNEMFEALHETGTELVVKIRKNAQGFPRHSPRGSRYRQLVVREYHAQRYRVWSVTKGNGMRWPGAERINSAVKRKFGENTVSRSPQGLVEEGYQRFWAYDEFRECGEARGEGATACTEAL